MSSMLKSINEQINAFMRGDLSDKEKVSLCAKCATYHRIIRQTLVDVDYVRHDEVALAPDRRKSVCDRLECKLGVVNKVRDQRNPERKQAVARTQIVEMVNYPSAGKPAIDRGQERTGCRTDSGDVKEIFAPHSSEGRKVAAYGSDDHSQEVSQRAGFGQPLPVDLIRHILDGKAAAHHFGDDRYSPLQDAIALQEIGFDVRAKRIE